MKLEGDPQGRGIDPKQELDLSVRHILRPEQQNFAAPLMEMLTLAVAEFSQLPPGRQEHEYPHTTAYFLSTDGKNLVMLRRRRPLATRWGRSEEDHHSGYYAEVFERDTSGKPQNWFSDLATLNGLYQRIDVTDESDDPYYGSLGLTPTKFGAIYRERLRERMRNQQKALPTTTSGDIGVLGQLFAQKQFRESVHEQQKTEERSLHEEIVERYFPNDSQGLTDEVGDNHLIITEDEDSLLVQASRSLGVTTHVVKVDQSWNEAGIDPFSEFRDARGQIPMLISLDRDSIERSQRADLPPNAADLAVTRLLMYASRKPLYTFIELVENKRYETRVGRLHPGWYLIAGKDPEVIKKVLTKVGIDYLLTSKVRELVGDLH